MIFQNSFLSDKSAEKIRKYYLDELTILKLDSFPERDNKKKRVFEEVKMSVLVFFAEKKKTDNYEFQLRVFEDRELQNYWSVVYSKKFIHNILYVIPYLTEIQKKVYIKLLEFLNGQSKSQVKRCFQGEINLTVHKKYLNMDDKNPKVIKGAGIHRYYLTDNMSQGIVEYLHSELYTRDYRNSKSRDFNYERIGMQGITGVDDKIRILCTLIPKGYFLAHSTNYIKLEQDDDKFYLLAFYNSTLANWFFKRTSTNSNVNSYEIQNIPLLKGNSGVSWISEKIYQKKTNNNYEDTTKLENCIDILVYKLYNLDPEEISVIDPNYQDVFNDCGITEEEYKNNSIDDLVELKKEYIESL